MKMFIGAIALIICGFVTGFFYHRNTVSRNLGELAWYKSNYLRKQGSALGYGTYELLSFDGGRNWCAVKRTSNNAVEILGSVEQVFPGLLAHLDGLDRLIRHAEIHGPLTLSGSRAQTEIDLLRGAGFEVR